MNTKLLLLGALVLLGMLWSGPPIRRLHHSTPPPKEAGAGLRDLRALASYRVQKEVVPDAASFQGVGYQARVDSAGLEFSGDAVYLRSWAARVEQGGRMVSCGPGQLAHPSFARSRIDRGILVEEYVFENRRVEQLFEIPRPIGEGDLTIRVGVATNLSGPVVEVPRHEGGWKDTPLWDGGLAFCDSAGEKKLSYHGAVAIDAAGRLIPLDPRWESGEIVLKVPAVFLEEALFPVTVDPWIELAFSATGGGISANAGTTFGLSIAVDSAGNPVVAWSDNTSGNPDIYLKRWNGTAWVELAGSATGGGISATFENSASPSLGVDGADNPVVAWQETAGFQAEIYLKRWNGTAWVELAGSATGGGISANAGASTFPSVAIDEAGNPVVAWGDNTSGSLEIYLKRWNGAAWVELAGSATGGGVSANAGSSATPSLALDGAGNPVVSWRDDTGGNNEVYLRRWLGTSWVELAGSATGGGISGNAGDSNSPSLELDATGNPTVAWRDNSNGGNNEIYLKRWTGTGWAELAGSASGGGISASAGPSDSPSLALDARDNPVVAWTDNVPGFEIYLKRWNGAAWVELGGSATGGGISANSGQSIGSSLALDDAGNPVVAWGDNTGGNSDLYLRRWYQDAPTGLAQMRSGGTTFIVTGGSTDETGALFRATVTSDNVGGGPLTVGLQVEVQPVGAAFTHVPSGQSALVSSGSTASLSLSGLTNGGYHWQARTVDSLGQVSQWVSFGGNGESQADFVVQASAAGTGVVVEGDEVGHCGALGLEGLVLLGLALALRRRKGA